MPLLDTPRTFYVEEWHRFMSGLNGLTPAGQQELLLRAYEHGKVPGERRLISIPGWDQVVHVSVHPPITREQWTEFFTAQRENRPPRLGLDVLAAVQEKQQLWDRLNSSPLPEYAQAWGNVVQALNAVDRSLVVLAVSGKMLLWPVLQGLEAFAPALTQAAALDALGIGVGATLSAGQLTAVRKLELGLAARLAGRLLPGLGWVLAVGDILQILIWLGTLGVVGYAALCRSPLEALAAGATGISTGGLPVSRLRAPRGAPASALKGGVWSLAGVNPFSTEARASRALELEGWMPSLHQGIRFFHLSHALNGHGLAFGGIMGAYAEMAYGAALAIQGERVGFNPDNQYLDAVGIAAAEYALSTGNVPVALFAGGTFLARKLGDYSGVELREKRRAAQYLQSGGQVMRIQDVFTVQEHARALVAYQYALDLVGEDFQGFDWTRALAAVMPRPLSPPATMRAEDALVMRQLGQPAESLGRWALTGAPRTVTPDELDQDLAASVPAAIEELLRPRRHDVDGMFLGCLIRTVTDRLWYLASNDHDFLRTRFTPDFRLLSSLAIEGRIPLVQSGPERIAGFWSEATAILADESTSGLSGAELDTLLLKHGVHQVVLE